MELRQRIRFNLPVTEMQAVQATIGRMWSSLETSRLVVADALERSGSENVYWDTGFSLTKYYVVEQALAMWRDAQRILGGAALLTDGPFERFMRDANCLVANAGTQLVLEIDLGVLAIDEVGRRETRPKETRDEVRAVGQPAPVR
jgi:alkylation response protein AidB-like acyl-CoA dehydrogenase